jgi:predicted nuclease of predicted toxin-antitoxin system
VPPEAERGPKAEDAVVLFIDRDTWSHALDAALSSAAIPFERHRDHFANDTEDVQWIAEVGRRGWVAVTRDQRIRHRPNELAAVRAAGLHLFALTSGNLSAAETAQVLLRAWPAIQRAVRSTEPPAIWSVTRGGEVRRLKA